MKAYYSTVPHPYYTSVYIIYTATVHNIVDTYYSSTGVLYNHVHVHVHEPHTPE
jgi:hypothetical protein